MGSPEREPDRGDDEDPQHEVTFEKPFVVGQFAVTVGEYRACVRAAGCKPPEWDEPGSKYYVKTELADLYRQLGEALTEHRHPIVGVSWHDAQDYAKWLSGKTGKKYRLLSEAEREYVTRAGTESPFWWGASISVEQANYNGNYPGWLRKTVPAKSFDPNPWGIYQVHGNVREWVEDCWNGNYYHAPRNGSTLLGEECTYRVLRGGSWTDDSQDLRAARRHHSIPDFRSSIVGLRVGRAINP